MLTAQVSRCQPVRAIAQEREGPPAAHFVRPQLAQFPVVSEAFLWAFQFSARRPLQFCGPSLTDLIQWWVELKEQNWPDSLSVHKLKGPYEWAVSP